MSKPAKSKIFALEFTTTHLRNLREHGTQYRTGGLHTNINDDVYFRHIKRNFEQRINLTQSKLLLPNIKVMQILEHMFLPDHVA